MPHEHTFHPFDTDMGKLRDGVLRMAALAERQLVRAVQAGTRQDQRLTARVLKDDPAVHELHNAIDAQAGLTIARQQPAAVDLREIVAVFHIIDDLERIGQESRRIARRVQPVDAADPLPGASRAETLSGTIAEALRKTIDAFVHRDGVSAAAQRAHTESLESEMSALLDAHLSTMAEGAEPLPQAIAMNFVLQSMSRSLSHVRHVAQYVEHAFEGHARVSAAD